mmetsp:Transcript_64516/g.188745  ORF Transcript_64516/g.188745 Transcript_64516/m.188745 type:complete len:105 (+) Transcript_64516:1306-1620(+)
MYTGEVDLVQSSDSQGVRDSRRSRICLNTALVDSIAFREASWESLTNSPSPNGICTPRIKVRCLTLQRPSRNRLTKCEPSCLAFGWTADTSDMFVNPTTWHIST